MTLSAILLSALLGLWWLLSAIGQFSDRFMTKASRHDPLTLIPRWTFFAPEPGTSDFRIVVQSRHGGNEISDWEEVRFYDRARFRFIFNPRKLIQKSMVDLVQGFFQIIGHEIERLGGLRGVSMASTPYIGLAEYVEAHLDNCRTGSCEYRFAVLNSEYGVIERENQPVYLSNWHKR